MTHRITKGETLEDIQATVEQDVIGMLFFPDGDYMVLQDYGILSKSDINYINERIHSHSNGGEDGSSP